MTAPLIGNSGHETVSINWISIMLNCATIFFDRTRLLSQILGRWTSVIDLKRTYYEKMPNLRKKASTIKKDAAQLTTFETQLIKTIFTQKFAMMEELSSNLPPPRIPRWGPAKLEIISAQLSPNGAQLISGFWHQKSQWGRGMASPQPSTPYLGLGVSTIEHNWCTIE